jgi:hypothetical protein
LRPLVPLCSSASRCWRGRPPYGHAPRQHGSPPVASPIAARNLHTPHISSTERGERSKSKAGGSPGRGAAHAQGSRCGGGTGSGEAGEREYARSGLARFRRPNDQLCSRTHCPRAVRPVAISASPKAGRPSQTTDTGRMKSVLGRKRHPPNCAAIARPKVTPRRVEGSTTRTTT